MRLEVLVATMNQTDHSLLDKMNIRSDAFIANQCNKNEVEEFNYSGYRIKYFSFAEKGVGLNRNNALMRSEGDISVLADDDLVYVDNYDEIIKEQFAQNPETDIIIFNLIEKFPKEYVIKKKYKINYSNYMRFGTARIAFRTESITKNGISFNIHFGGGARYSAGEDTLFLTDCLKKGLNIIAVPVFIAYLSDTRESTWFRGYTDKFFKDKGVLFYYISKKWAYLLCLQFCIRHRAKFENEKNFFDALKFMLQGINEEKSTGASRKWYSMLMDGYDKGRDL